MTSREERAALQEKVDELHKVTGEMEERLSRLPFTRDSETLREMMVNMLGQLHQMDREMRAMLRYAEENEKNSEGGTENGGQVESKPGGVQ